MRHHGIPVSLDLTIVDNKEKSFWHLVKHSMKWGNDGVYDISRAKRLPWVRDVVCSCPNSQITEFNYLEGSGFIHRYLWVKSVKYVVILKSLPMNKATREFLLVTAFEIDFAQKEKDLESKYQDRL
jgi:hypothetical protein